MNVNITKGNVYVINTYITKHHKKYDKNYHIEKSRFGTFLKKDSLNNFEYVEKN